MQSLKEILIDAARYRWLRENVDEVHFASGGYAAFSNPGLMDNYISEILEEEND